YPSLGRFARRVNRPLTILLTVAVVLGALFSLPMLIGVWLPDVITAREHTLAEQRLASGYSFRVVQYWNRVDFYSTELRVTSPDGRTEVHTLDGDDSKSWRLPLTVDEQSHTATVMLGGGRERKVAWK
ncbi:MAG: hypothetical protein KJ070_23290, partial [Verrucomicrobia bacterium]|nr:hypothetical protein [Verrucomicrobiota bacterium]